MLNPTPEPKLNIPLSPPLFKYSTAFNLASAISLAQFGNDNLKPLNLYLDYTIL